MLSFKHQKPLQYDSIHHTLSQILGNFNEIDGLTSYICHEPSNMTLHHIISTLLDKNIHIHTLLTAISACEKQRLQYAFESTKTLPSKTQFSSAKKIIHDFNGIQNTLLSTADTYFDNLTQRKEHNITSFQVDTGNRSTTAKTKENNRHQEVISESIKAWKKSGEISIRNYYQGITIRASALFIIGEDKEVQIKLNEEVARIFAIHPNKSDAFAVCAGEKVQVHLNINAISKGKLILKLGKVFPVYAEDRQHLNVQVSEEIPLKVCIGRQQHRLHAYLHDLSIGGIGIHAQASKQTPYNIGDNIKCQLTLDEKPIRLHGIIRWTGTSNDKARMGIELHDSYQAQQLIQKEVFRLQRNIINTINQLDLPKELSKSLA